MGYVSWCFGIQYRETKFILKIKNEPLDLNINADILSLEGLYETKFYNYLFDC